MGREREFGDHLALQAAAEAILHNWLLWLCNASRRDSNYSDLSRNCIQNPEVYAINVRVISANYEDLTHEIVLNRETVGTAVLGFYPVGMHYDRLVEENVDLPQQEAHLSLSEFVF